MSMTRRQALSMVLAASALPMTGFGPGSQLDIAEIDLGPGTLSRPGGWARLLHEVDYNTSVACGTRSVRVKPEDVELFAHPFCVLLGDGAFRPPSARGLEQLSRYLSYGGFLLIDDTSGAARSGFDDSVKRLVAMLFPTRPLAPIPADHSLYRSFFLIDEPVGRVDRHGFLQAVTVGDLAPVVYCRNDLSGALDRTPDGRSVNACVPGGERQRREAVKLGINLVLYSLTANYKRDQAHTRQLILEGRID